VKSFDETGLPFELLDSNPFLVRNLETESSPSPILEIQKVNILLVAQSLIYNTYSDPHFDTEGRWSLHGKEEGSEEVGKKSDQEEEVVVAP
jgi:hypothetical protein